MVDFLNMVKDPFASEGTMECLDTDSRCLCKEFDQ